jgi:hypothetical protein
VSPFKVDRFDNKPQRWAYGIDIFIHDPFDDSGFARIIEATTPSSAGSILSVKRKDLTASAHASPYPSTGPSSVSRAFF